MGIKSSGILALLLAGLWPVLQGERQPQARILPVEDKGAVRALAKKLGAEAGKLESGRVELGPCPGSAQCLVVFLDGTEIGRLEDIASQVLLDEYPELREVRSASRAGKTSVSALPGLPWQRWGRWEEKATVGYDLDYLYSGILVRRNQIHAAALKKIAFLYLGADVTYLSFKGELPDSVPYAAKAGSLGWGATLGAPFVRYHLKWAPFALPDYFWAESRLKGKYFNRGSGDGTSVVRIFEATAPPTWEHNLEARAGWLRYTFTLSPEIYRAPLHFLALDDLPGVLGVWGMGLLMTPDGFIPGGWYRFAPINLAHFEIGERAAPLELSLGRLSYFRADRSQFRLAWNAELAFGL